MGRRRYKIGENPVYDRAFDNGKKQSPLLNVTAFRVNMAAMRMGDKRGLRSLLLEREGRPEDGCFLNHRGEKWLAKIPRLRAELEAIKKAHKDLKTQARNAGKPEPPMPQELQDQKLKLEAALDITLEETDKCRKLLEELEVKEQKAKKNKMLRYGPRGHGKGEPLRELDGQRISQLNQELIIDDPRSPYNKMRVQDYRQHVVRPWLARGKKTGAVKFAKLPKWPKNIKKVEDLK